MLQATQRPPARFHSTVAAATRTPSFSSERFIQPTRIEAVRVSFALNTQRTLRLRFWLAMSTSTRTTTGSNQTVPTEGRNLLAGWGDVDYVVGDGQEGEIRIPLNVDHPGGFYLCVDADNQDGSNSHTVDVTFDLLDL